ncbi:MAG: glycosyltransferase family 4 protein [Anaerolineae bacterium]
MPWRVLYLDHADWMGGAEQSLLLLLQHLDPAQVEPLLVCTGGSPLEQAARTAGVPVAEVPFGPLRGRRNPAALVGQLARGSASLVRLARSFRADCIHTNVARASAYGALVALRTGIPLVWHVRDVHDTRRPDEWLFVQGLARLARGIVCASGATARPLPRFAAPKVFRVPNGLDVPRFDPGRVRRQAVRDSWGVRPDQVLVGTVGWLAPWKQTEHFLQVAEQVTVPCPQARFVVVGEAASPRYAAHVARLKEWARERLGGRVQFVGPQEDVPGVMAALDILVHTARAEPFGRVLLEAMALERPVVAYADGGVPEVVLHGETGLLARPGDVAGLSQLVQHLIREPAERRRLGQAGRRRVLQEFTAEAMARRMEQVYEAVLGAPEPLAGSESAKGSGDESG